MMESSVILGLFSLCIIFSVSSLLMKIFIPGCLTYSKLKSSSYVLASLFVYPLALPTSVGTHTGHLCPAFLSDVPLFSLITQAQKFGHTRFIISLYLINSAGNYIVVDLPLK